MLEAAVLGVVLFVLLQHLFDRCVFVVFQARDLDRARRLASGQPILFGPETSGGGHLPGSFYYLLLALPLALGRGWVGAWQLEMGMMAGAGALSWWFMRSRFGLASAWITLASLMTSDFMYANLLHFENPSFLPLFAALSLMLLCRAFAPAPEADKARAWLLACLCCGVGVQIHFTLAFVLLAGVLLQLGAAGRGVRPLSPRGFARGLASSALTLAPYGCWLASRRLSIPLGQPALPFTGENLLGWTTVLYRAARLPPSVFARGYLRDLLVSLVPTGAFFALGTMALVARAGGVAERERASSSRADFAAASSKVLLVACLATFVPCLFIVARSFNRYGVVFIVAASLLIGVHVARYARLPGRPFGAPAVLGPIVFLSWALLCFGPSASAVLKASTILLLAALGLLLALSVHRASPKGSSVVLLVAVGLLPSLISLRCYAERSEGESLTMTFKDFESLSRDIRSRTGWSYAQAKERLFYFNARKHVSPSYIYDGLATAEDSASGRDRPPPIGIDGFLVGRFSDDGSWRGIQAVKPWLLAQDIEPTLKAGIGTGGIALGAASAYDRLVIVPYRIEDKERFPPYFHDLGEGYAWDRPRADAAPIPGSRKLRSTINDSPSRRPIYDIFADVDLVATGRGRWSVDVTLSGEPISEGSYWFSPDWTQELLGPYFSYSCAGRERRVQLAGALGPSYGKHGDLVEGRSFLAPYERRFSVRCSRPLAQLGVGYESSLAYEGGKPRMLAGKLQRLQQPLGDEFGAVGARTRRRARGRASDSL